MQKKHLHLFLLLLALVGCSPRKYPEVNPYFTDKNKFAIDLDDDAPAALFYGGVDLRVHGLSSPSFLATCYPFIDRPWEAQWGNLQGDPLSMSHRSTERSLLALTLKDSVEGFVQRAIPLPDGRGVAFYLDSKVGGPFSLSLTTAFDDTLWSPTARKLNDKLIAIDGPDSSVLVAGAGEGIALVKAVSAPPKAPAWTLVLAKTRNPQVILAFGHKTADAQAVVEKYLGLSPDRLEREAISGLEARAGFSLHTSDDRANRVAALLSSALVGADVRVPKGSRAQIEESSQLATALFLASRERPQMVFPPWEKYYTEQAKRDHLRWGSVAFRDALNWGMADDDSLRWLSLDILSGLERLQAEYATSDIAVVADETPADSLMRLATAHVRLAALMGLAEEIGFARGDHEAQNTFRKESVWAGKRAHDLFAKSAQAYIRRQLPARPRWESSLDTATPADTIIEDAPDPETMAPPTSYPDTVLFLNAGARYGFTWLDQRPALMWNPRLAVGGFIWQKWLAYRLRNDVKLSETPDFDSLTSIVLDGPAPGFLTADPAYAGEPSLSVMAAAFQNFAEIYLGVKPDAFEHKVWIEPRIPSSWGHTAARMPFSTGLLRLEYDFAHDYAVVGMDNISREIQIFFGYPLPNGGFLRTQFILVPGEHPQRIQLIHKKENRLELEVNDVP